MDEISIFLLIVVHVIATVMYVRSLPKYNLWIYPFTYFLIVHLIHYPARALYLLYVNNPNDIPIPDLTQSLAYATMFYVVFVITSILLVKVYSCDNSRIYTVPRTHDDNKAVVYGASTVIVILATILIIIYKLKQNQIYALYSDIEQLEFSLTEVILQSVSSLRWVCIFMCIQLYLIDHQKKYVYYSMIIVMTLIFESLLTTSKGTILYLVFLYFMGCNLAKTRLNKLFLLAGFVCSLIFSAYSYMARFYGVVSGEFTVSNITDTFSGIIDNIYLWYEKGLVNLFDRFNYLDGLAIISKIDGKIDKGLFEYGSVAELLNFIPRSVWPERPLISYNHYMTDAVWGLTSFSENPIGRVGESFLTFGYFGLLLSIIYPILFFLLYYFMYHIRGSIASRSIYLYLVIMYVMPDAYMMYGIKKIVISLIMMFVVLETTKFAINNKLKIKQR